MNAQVFAEAAGGPGAFAGRCRAEAAPDLARIFAALDMDPRAAWNPARLPFGPGDVTAGSETELQTVVVGRPDAVDLPLSIIHSNYFANMRRRTESGDLPPAAVRRLEEYLYENRSQVWENSWVRVPLEKIEPGARREFEADLQADKERPATGLRTDHHKFFCRHNGRDALRMPVSYLLKLALGDAMAAMPASSLVRQIGERLARHLLNDNTSPESFSFHVTTLRRETGMGRALARETARRQLLTQLLVQYANRKFELTAGGQHTLVYFSPHPPVRQQMLNECISDAFYRELFMSPCLSGWNCGEDKHHYMNLCHQVLSRSQLNAVAKLREAGIILNNLVVLPSMSNISLANNGVHVSLGSRRLTRHLKSGTPGFGAVEEKYVGDLAIKIVEHFLPLFVGTYSAAPFRMGFDDFHPEKALGFLPHQLDYTHLRMLWRRWSKKADLRAMGHVLTPFGPAWLDRGLSGLFRLRGDYVCDARLLNYPVALMSTGRSPAFDGTPGNQDRLKQDLHELGVFDAKMSFYCLYRQRECARMGFTGFEGRFYSLFEDLGRDLGAAVDLQTLITALAFKYMARGEVTHADIPDTPEIESERRQVFFGAAIGLPTFYVRRDTRNRFLARIVGYADRVRPSHRYASYTRVRQQEYRLALLATLRRDAADLIEMLGMEETLADLEARLRDPAAGAAGRIESAICGELGVRTPLDASAAEFNLAAERYYRGPLRRRHMAAAWEELRESFRTLEERCARLGGPFASALRTTLPGGDPTGWLERTLPRIMDETASVATLRTMVRLMALAIEADRRELET